jgi:hypothetical protein
MKNIIIKDERNYRVISGNAISILDRLPAAIYEVCFEKGIGFSLIETDNNFSMAKKLYGDVEAITTRVLRTFDITESNLGVLFSGPKGLGKSLTARNICAEAIKKDIPVILVTENFDNITSFIETINQNVVVFIDEFEKLYPDFRSKERDVISGQDSLLNLFDSTLSGKKLFLLTCNDVSDLSGYLLNRPGRLHYHFKTNRLSIDRINEYCSDNLPSEMSGIIPEICSLGARIPDFSYDMLKAIIFELKEYRSDLPEVKRILNIEAQARSAFDFTVYFKSGRSEAGHDYINPTWNREQIDWYKRSDGEDSPDIADIPQARWTGKPDGSLLLDGNYVHWSPEDEKSNDRIEKIIFVPAKKDIIPD